ncbi:MAG: DUF4097 family beta strand repeat protein [Acidobacteria bacterium]|nr:DUF4097 family beta strand repeat protein [Acidobacteriota bacterium]
MNSRSLWLTACLLALSSLAFAGAPQGSFQKTFSVSGPVDLEVLTHSGDITIHPGPAGSVTVRGKIFVGDTWFRNRRQSDVTQIEQNPPIQQDGNRIRIDYVGVSNIAVDYEITAPADTMVRTQTGSGDQTIQGMRQGLELESGSGDIRLREIAGQVHIRTGSGNLDAQQISGPIHAEAGSGDIGVDESGSGEVQVHTGSGNIAVHGAKGALEVEAGSGDITLAGVLANPWTVRTGSGDVQIELPAQANFELDAATNSGDLTIDRPLDLTVQGNLSKEHHNLRGTVGSGGPVLAIHTGSGDIHIQ